MSRELEIPISKNCYGSFENLSILDEWRHVPSGINNYPLARNKKWTNLGEDSAIRRDRFLRWVGHCDDHRCYGNRRDVDGVFESAK